MNPWRWVDPRVRSLSVHQVRRSLEARGWREKPNAPPGLVIYEAVGEKSQTRQTCVLPAQEAAPDRSLSLAYFLTTLSEIEDRHPVELLEEMLEIPAAVQLAPQEAMS